MIFDGNRSLQNLKFYFENFGKNSNFLMLQYRAKFLINVLNDIWWKPIIDKLKFYFEIEIFSQYNVCVLVGGLAPPVLANTSSGFVIFQDGYLSKELISTSKTNGWSIYLEQFEIKLSILWWGTEQRPIYATNSLIMKGSPYCLWYLLQWFPSILRKNESLKGFGLLLLDTKL